MIRQIFAAAFFLLFALRPLHAQQDVVWVQIEALPSLTAAQDRVRNYAATLPDVNGFALGSGWYAIALGPYTRGDAQQVLSVYRAEGAIPADSYIAFSQSFRQQFWPIGANLLNLPAATPATPAPAPQPEPQADAPAATPAETAAAAPQPEPDESPREARASEARLDRSEREALQVALKWAGFYDAAIDGAFGPGTRRSMADWQAANGFEATGVLTTLQRATLLRQYNAVLDGLGLASVVDTEAGIEIPMPTSIVGFGKYEYPFAHYTSTGDLPATVLLISQRGDRSALFGLYDIMQTLEVIPPEGLRRRDDNSFLIVGEGADFVSQTEVALENGEIKGFTLIWPAGDEARRTRLLGEMRKGLRRLPGTLNPAQVSDEQRIDLVSGLEIRKPKLARSGFFVDDRGTVATTTEAVAGCGAITLEDGTEADVLASDETLGVAVLLPRSTLAPQAVARFQPATPRLQSEVAVAGYSYGGLLGAPTMTFGRLADIRGLGGEESLRRLDLQALPGDAGGPVVDATGAVIGLLLPRPGAVTGRTLPEGVSFALAGPALAGFLDSLGITTATTAPADTLSPEQLTTATTPMAVLVNCWE